MTHHQNPPINPAASGVPDPLIATPQVVTGPQAVALTESVEHLRSAVNRRTVGFTVVLIVMVLIGAAVAVLGWRSEHFLTCQVQQNSEFRNAAATERAAQRRLFDIVLNPASTPADRLKASQAYYAGLIAADKQRTNAAGTC